MVPSYKLSSTVHLTYVHISYNTLSSPYALCVGGSVADPHHLDADPTYHFDADPDPDFYLMRIRIFTLLRIRIPASKYRLKLKCSNRLLPYRTFWLLICTWMRIRIRTQSPYF
jgi:hypothetical protein